jgi:hypothetical protein
LKIASLQYHIRAKPLPPQETWPPNCLPIHMYQRGAVESSPARYHNPSQDFFEPQNEKWGGTQLKPLLLTDLPSARCSITLCRQIVNRQSAARLWAQLSHQACMSRKYYQKLDRVSLQVEVAAYTGERTRRWSPRSFLASSSHLGITSSTTAWTASWWGHPTM